MTTNVPFPVFGPAGYTVPAETAILAGVQADWQSAFNGTLNFTTTTGSVTNPTAQGQITSSETAIIGENNAEFLQYIAGVDPATSTGRMQDGIARIYFLNREPAEPSVVTCLISGSNPTVVPVGAIIQDALGNSYNCTAQVTIPVSGSISTTFQNNLTGPIAWQTGAGKISRAIGGWDSVSITSGVLGRNVETAQAFEARRAASVAGNALGTIPAIQGAVLRVSGVLDAYVTDNATDGPLTVGGVTLNANALYVCSYGGDAQDIGQAIWSKKQPGGPYYTSGNTTVTVTDPSPQYTTPPAYTVIFETANPLAPYFVVTVVNSALVPSNALALIQASLANAFTGADGGTPARIGATLIAGRYYPDVASLGAWAQVFSIQIGVATVSFTGTISGTVLTASSVTGTFVVGQVIFGASVSAGSIIVSFGTGTGGAGTYNLAQSSAVLIGEAMVASTVGYSVTMNINQIPSYVAAQTTLVLI